MRLNMECVRDILLCVEKNTGLHECCYFIDATLMESTCYAMGEDTEPIPRYQKEICENGRYSDEVLFYHVKYCAEAGLLKMERGTAEYKAKIAGLTFDGHNFTENIRDKRLWGLARKSMTAAGSTSLEIAKRAAEMAALGQIGKTIQNHEALYK